MPPTDRNARTDEDTTVTMYDLIKAIAKDLLLNMDRLEAAISCTEEIDEKDILRAVHMRLHGAYRVLFHGFPSCIIEDIRSRSLEEERDASTE